MKFKKGQRYGSLCTEIVSEDERKVVAVVWTHKSVVGKESDKPVYEEDKPGIDRLNKIIDALNSD